MIDRDEIRAMATLFAMFAVAFGLLAWWTLSHTGAH